jgi:hypothetical protein
MEQDAVMTEEEIELVAQELAKAGGNSWHTGQVKNGVVRAVSNRYRERARVAIAALDRHRRQMTESRVADDLADELPPVDAPSPELVPGATVVYRPYGDRRAYTYRIERISGQDAYLKPVNGRGNGWVPLSAFSDSVSSSPATDVASIESAARDS